MINPKIMKIYPTLLLSGVFAFTPSKVILGKMEVTNTEPSFPHAAEMPWQVQRYRVGKISAGRMNVIVFAPVGTSNQYGSLFFFIEELGF